MSVCIREIQCRILESSLCTFVPSPHGCTQASRKMKFSLTLYCRRRNFSANISVQRHPKILRRLYLKILGRLSKMTHEHFRGFLSSAGVGFSKDFRTMRSSQKNIPQIISRRNRIITNIQCRLSKCSSESKRCFLKRVKYTLFE